jgi:hypothetical protein
MNPSTGEHTKAKTGTCCPVDMQERLKELKATDLLPDLPAHIPCDEHVLQKEDQFLKDAKININVLGFSKFRKYVHHKIFWL